MTSPASSTRGWIGPYLLLAVLWGCSFLFIATALQTFAPTQVAFGRIVVGLALLAAILLARRERVRVERTKIGDFVIVGAVMTAVPFVLFALAEQRVSSVLAGLVNATTPLFTAVFVALLLPAERPDRVQVGGLVLGFGGIAVLLGIWDPGAIDLLGGVMLLGATFCYGLGNAWARRRLTATGLSNVALPAIQLAVGAVVILPFAVTTPPTGTLTPAPALALLALGLGGTGLAYVLFWRVLALAGATVTASVTYVIPLVSTTLGVLVLHEGLHWYEPVGGAVVLAGVGLTQWGAARRRSADAARAENPGSLDGDAGTAIKVEAGTAAARLPVGVDQQAGPVIDGAERRAPSTGPSAGSHLRG
ncbi:DMT family transporter [uncultured Cellulomonas sp.]|uniref:DMT family transporter n=1 Tax=uncultured Cellulomonas sp. TaxID=189682 RepID=UPI0028E9AF68|nr:DMT family transporter [uncultured Cellulomonas sp.]